MTRDRSPGESFAQLQRSFGPGDEIDVVVVQVGQNAVFVALDDKQEGFIEVKDLTGPSGQIAVKAGSLVRARVVEIGGSAGAVRLAPISVRDADPDSQIDPPSASGASVQTGGVTLMVGSHVRGKVAIVEVSGKRQHHFSSPKYITPFQAHRSAKSLECLANGHRLAPFEPRALRLRRQIGYDSVYLQ